MTLSFSVYTNPPEDFNPGLQAAGCVCEWEDKILILQRSPHKFQGGKWAIPGGKMEGNETPRSCAIREIEEEAGLNIDADDLEMIGSIYCRLPDLDYIFHIFRKRFVTLPNIKIGIEEHTQGDWFTVEEGLK
ncbi:MAG: NUDIX hydrolase, partial [Parachlamydiaceae bacterium]|nr:NUDIX hydrolase [Parachlamydiaceae bacterium]